MAPCPDDNNPNYFARCFLDDLAHEPNRHCFEPCSCLLRKATPSWLLTMVCRWWRP